MTQAKQRLQALSLNHVMEIEKIFTFYPLDETKKSITPVSGLQGSFWIRQMMKTNTYFKEKCSDLMTTDLLDEALSFTRNNLQNNEDEEQILERIRSGKPTFLLSGFLGHSVDILIWGNYFVLCNRGEGSRKPLEVFCFDPEKINLSILNNMLNRTQSIEKYESLFFTRMPKELGFKEKQKTDFPSILESSCPLGDQTIGNCSYASMEEAVWAFFVLNRVLNEEKEQSVHPHVLGSIIGEQTERFWSWQAFNQAYHIERYLRARVIRPAKKKKEDPVYKLDSQLIKEAFLKVNRRVDNRVVNLIDKLEKNYEQQYRSNKKLFTSR